MDTTPPSGQKPGYGSSMSDWVAHVHPHSDLIALAPRLWLVTGSLPRSPLPRNMIVYQLRGGGLLVHSAIAMDDDRLAALDAIGPLQILVVPNGMHRADAAVFAERYPDAKVVCPQGAQNQVEKVVRVDAVDTALLPEHGIECHSPVGEAAGAFELCYELPLDDGVALVFTDLLFNQQHLPGFSGLIARYVTASTGFFGVTRIGRMFLWGRTPQLRAWLLEQAARDDVRAITVAHGSCIDDHVSRQLTEAAHRL